MKQCMTRTIYCRTIFNSRELETAKMPINRELVESSMELNIMKTTEDYHEAIKKNENCFCTLLRSDLKNVLLKEREAQNTGYRIAFFI